MLRTNEIAISMDGRGRWMDNVFIERLWRSVKYEEVYLKGYEGMREAKVSLGRYFEFYNTRRRHQSLDKRTPDDVYYESVARMAARTGTSLSMLSKKWGPLLPTKASGVF